MDKTDFPPMRHKFARNFDESVLAVVEDDGFDRPVKALGGRHRRA